LSEDLVSPGQLEAVGERALRFQRYIFRRAYGAYYAIWAFAILVFQLLPYAIFSLFGPTIATYLVIGIASVSIGILATVVSVRSFGEAARTVALRHVLYPAESIKSRYGPFILLWAAFIGIFAIGFVSSVLTFFSLLNGLLLLLDIFIVTQLREAFPHDIPLEGKVAVVAFGGSALSSFVISFLNVSPLLTNLSWIVTVAVWLFSSLYALRRAPEELVAPSR
jgi:hypothetical protein